ncbi:DUF4974 domain-containing protein [Sphingobacterium shayense]|uniref:FecR family protein n=1 Tax=Sphingobacterium shayense TaxID=626343 RepID=UPI001552E4E5|nr:FecR domain-containing protein [Sphingobacterium shayense]NQD72006.1 DUF4974 domain-containing protein [Sphingobacterium shayense]
MKREMIIRCISGNGTTQELAQLHDWLNADIKNEEQYIKMKKVWEIGDIKNSVPQVDVDQAWKNFMVLREQRYQGGDNSVIIRRRDRRLWWNAALLIGLLGIATLWSVYNANTNHTNLVTTNQIRSEVLPDGSKVTLNRNSALDYNKSWLSVDRSVRMEKGEAYFEVKPDAEHPFVIQSGNARITVLGTSFHVRHDGNQTQVIVNSGVVNVRYGRHEAILTASQGLTISDTTRRKVSVEPVEDQLYRYYVHQEFIFENTPLSRVFKTFEKAYDVRFVFDNPEDQNLLLTTTFEQQSLSEMLNVITKTFNLKLKKIGNIYHFEKKNEN